MHTKSTNIQNHIDYVDHVVDHLNHVMNHVDSVVDHEDPAVDYVDHVVNHKDYMVENVNHVDYVINHVNCVVDHVNNVDHVDNVAHVVNHVNSVDHVVNHVNSVDQKDKENNLDNDLQLIVEKHEKGNEVMLDLINLNNKYDADNRWKIMAQICSYSILFKGDKNLQVSVEKFMILISDKTIANSGMVMVRIIYLSFNYLHFCFLYDFIKVHIYFQNHRSIFIKDHSKVFNLADLVCNEIKLAITFGNIKNPEEIKLYLDQLTKIMEICKLKSKTVNPAFISELLCSKKEEQSTMPQLIDVFNKQSDLEETKQNKSLLNLNKQCRIKQSSNNYTRVYKSKSRKKNRHQ